MQPEIEILEPENPIERERFRYMSIKAFYRDGSGDEIQINTIVRFATHDVYNFIYVMHVAIDNLRDQIRKLNLNEINPRDTFKPPDRPEGNIESGQQDMEVLAAIARLEEMRKSNEA